MKCLTATLAVILMFFGSFCVSNGLCASSPIWQTFDTFDGTDDYDHDKWHPWNGSQPSAIFQQVNGTLEARVPTNDWFGPGLNARVGSAQGIETEITLEQGSGNVGGRIHAGYWILNGSPVTCFISVNPYGIDWYYGYSPTQEWEGLDGGSLIKEDTIGKTYTLRIYFEMFTVHFEVEGKNAVSRTVNDMEINHQPGVGISPISLDGSSFTTRYDNVSVYATEYSLGWLYVQKRRHDNGNNYNRLGFGFRDITGNYVLEDMVENVELFDPDGTQISFTRNDFSIYQMLYGWYDSRNSKWNYDDGFSMESSYAFNFQEPLKSGEYRLRITDNRGNTHDFTTDFNGIVDLPMVPASSFVSHTDSSGNFIWKWGVPSSPIGADTSARAMIQVFADETYKGEIYVSLPTHMGYLYVPPEVVAEAEALGNAFKLGIQLRTNDNNNRTYSNFKRWDETSPPVFDINLDGVTGLEEAIHALRIVTGH